MTKLAEQLKQGADQAWESLSDGWRELSARASGALTRFWPSPAEPSPAEPCTPVAELPHPPSLWQEGPLQRWGGWSFMAADLIDDDDKLTVRIEAPGMRREDFRIDLVGNVLSMRGDKRVDHEAMAGRLRLMQCAYGSFRRDIVLPVPVQADGTQASYRDGVLRVELRKSESARARRIAVHAA